MPAWSFVSHAHHPRVKVLAWDDGERLITEPIEGFPEGKELPSGDYEAWKKVCADSHCDVRTGRIGQFRYLDSSIRDPRAIISATRNQADSGASIVRIDYQVGKRRFTLSSAESWGGADLATQRAVFDAFGIGTYPTPGALGSALMRKLLWESRENIKADLRQPDPACLADLKQATVGMRTETPAADGSYASIITDLDRSSCYVTEATKPLPCGKVRPFGDESEILEGEWYVALCVATITHTIPLGPFPIRASDGTLQWPIRRGIYQDVWLTSGEIKDTRSSGCLVQIIRGWVWSDRRPFLRPWAEAILAARSAALTEAQDDPNRPPTGVSPGPTAVADLVKLVGNFAIGRLALSGPRLVVRLATGETDPLILDQKLSYYEAIPDTSNPAVTLPHVALCIWSEARREEYRYQLELIKAGKLVYLTNTDEILVDGEVEDIPAGWRRQTLTDLVIVGNRSYVCNERSVLPGRTAEAREQAIQYAQEIVWKKQRFREEHPTEWYLMSKHRLRDRGSSLASLSQKDWSDYVPRSGMPDHLSDLADVVIDAGLAGG